MKRAMLGMPLARTALDRTRFRLLSPMNTLIQIRITLSSFRWMRIMMNMPAFVGIGSMPRIPRSLL